MTASNPNAETTEQFNDRLSLVELSKRLQRSPVQEQDKRPAEPPQKDDTYFRPVALDLLDTGGHWWNCVDAEPPDHYAHADREVRGLDDLPEEHRPTVPPQVEWSALAEYGCRHCRDRCINRMDTVYAHCKLCRSCYAQSKVLELDGPERRTGYLPPEWAAKEPYDPSESADGATDDDVARSVEHHHRSRR